MDPLVWAALLLLLGLILLVAEVFIPSGGVFGVLSVLSITSGIVMAFYHRGLEAGVVFLIITAVVVPIALTSAFRWWPHTPMGRRLLLDAPRGDEVLPDTPQRRALRQLVGRFGVAKTVMLPSGAIEVGGLSIDAISEGMPIEAGQRVRVIEVRGNRVVVRPSDEAPAEPDDILSRPIESLGIEGLDEPLA